MNRRPGPEIELRTIGPVSPSAARLAAKPVATFVRRLPEQPRTVRLKLTWRLRSGLARPALAQAVLEFHDGRRIRAQLAAGFFPEAGILLRQRLHEHYRRLTHPAGGLPWPDPTREQLRPESIDLPWAERRIVRWKAVPLQRVTPEQAAQSMDVLDYDFHLFTDAASGQDSMVYRIGPSGYRLARLAGQEPPRASSMPTTLNLVPITALTTAQAAEKLICAIRSFQFYRLPTTGRGAVLYRRHDGHHGLLTAPGRRPTFDDPGAMGWTDITAVPVQRRSRATPGSRDHW